MSNTYNLTQAYLEVLNKLDEGYSFEDLKDTLDSIEEELNIKVDNTIGLKRSVDADVETIDKEIKRLQAIKKQKVNLSDRLKGYLLDMLDQRKLDKYRTSTNYIYKRSNAPSVHITNEGLIDKSYFVEQEPKLDKKALKEDIQAGADVEGAELISTVSLVVK